MTVLFFIVLSVLLSSSGTGVTFGTTSVSPGFGFSGAGFSGVGFSGAGFSGVGSSGAGFSGVGSSGVGFSGGINVPPPVCDFFSFTVT